MAGVSTSQQIADEQKELTALLNNANNFNVDCKTRVDPFFWFDAKENAPEWKQVMSHLKHPATPTFKIARVQFENDEASLATLATVDVVIELVDTQSFIVRFVKVFKLHLSPEDKRLQSLKELHTLFQSLTSLRQFAQFVNVRADKKGKVMFAAMDSSVGGVGVISNVAAKGKTVTFIVTKHQNLMGGPQVKRMAVKADVSRVTPDGKHLVVQTGPQSWSVFEAQPALQKFELSQVDIEELQRILDLQK